MRTLSAVAVAALSVFVVLGGCSGDDPPPPGAATTGPPAPGSGAATTTAAPGASTTLSMDALKAALLTPADVPGSTPLASAPLDIDLSTCFPDNPLGARTDPAEIKAPGLQLGEGANLRRYAVRVRRATVEQARSLVASWATPAASSCVTDAYKVGLNTAASGKADVSGLTGTGSTAPVGDGGALISIVGVVPPVQLGIDLLAFQKGSAVVFLSVLGGSSDPALAIDLARKVDGRLS